MKRSNRSVQKILRVSPEEEKAFLDLAEKRGTGFSDLVRQLLHRELKAEAKETAVA